MARERDRRDAEGFLTPGWLPGEARAGFGEAGLGVRGVLTRGKYPAAAFPHPDVGLTQVFWGETLCFVNLSFHKTASVRFTRQREDSSRTSVALAPILSSPTTPRA